MSTTTKTVAVVMVPRLDNPKKNEHAVTVDGEIVLRTSGVSQWDYCQASSFAEGVRFALSKFVG